MVNPNKVEWVDELKELIHNNSHLLFTDFKGLTVEETQQLRRKLYERDSRYCVVKNRLAYRAFDEAAGEAVPAAEETGDLDVDSEYELGDIKGVGPSKVEAMEEAGYKKISEIAEAGEEELQEISGVGPSLAAKIKGNVQELSGGNENEESTETEVQDDLAEQVAPLLKGNTAIIFNEGQVGEVTEVVVDFQEEHEALGIKGSLVEGQLFEPDQVEEIADLPSRRELLTRVARGINSPLQKLVQYLKNPLQKLTDVLNQIKEQKED